MFPNFHNRRLYQTSPPPTDPKGDEGKKKPQLQLIPPALNDETAKALTVSLPIPGGDAGHNENTTGIWYACRVWMCWFIGKSFDPTLDLQAKPLPKWLWIAGMLTCSCWTILGDRHRIQQWQSGN